MTEMTMNPEAMAQEIARLKAENLALQSKKTTGKITLKVSEKGAVSVYGLGRFPVTLYASQWENLMNHGAAIKDFLIANAPALASKQ